MTVTLDPLTWPRNPALDAKAGTAICPSCGERIPFVSGACGRWMRCPVCGEETHMTGTPDMERVSREAYLRLVRTVRPRETVAAMTSEAQTDYRDSMETARVAAWASLAEVDAFYSVIRNRCDRCGLAGTLTITPAGELCIYCYERARDEAEYADIVARFPHPDDNPPKRVAPRAKGLYAQGIRSG